MRILVSLTGLLLAGMVSGCCWYSVTSGKIKYSDCKLDNSLVFKDEAGEEFDIGFNSCRVVFEDDSGGCVPNGGASRQRFLLQLTNDGNDEDSWRTPEAQSLTMLGDLDTYGSYHGDVVGLKKFSRPFSYPAMMDHLGSKGSGSVILTLEGETDPVDYRSSGTFSLGGYTFDDETEMGVEFYDVELTAGEESETVYMSGYVELAGTTKTENCAWGSVDDDYYNVP